MSSKTKTESKGSPEEAVKAAVETTAGGTTEGIAQVAGIGRSTAGKVLGRLATPVRSPAIRAGATAGSGCRTAGRSPGSRCPPPTPGMCSRPSSRPVRRATARAPRHPPPTSRPAGRASPQSGKLKPGGLDPLVLGYLEDNADSGPHGPTQVAKALQRSSGAVGNCLARLTEEKKAKLVTEKPRRYSIA